MSAFYIFTTLSKNKKTRIERVVTEAEFFASVGKERAIPLLDETHKKGTCSFETPNGSTAVLAGPYLHDDARLQLGIQSKEQVAS